MHVLNLEDYWLDSINSFHSQAFTQPNHTGFPHPITGLTLTVMLLIINVASNGAVNHNRSKHGLSVDSRSHDLAGNGLLLMRMERVK